MKNERLYPVHVRAVVDTLLSIFKEGFLADKAIQYTLRSNPKAGSKDRAFIASSTYDIVRWWRKYWFLLGKEEQHTEAAIWELFAVYWLVQGNELPDWEEFNNIQKGKIESRRADAEKTIAIRESVPDWLFELGAAELSEEKWGEEIAAMNGESTVYIRANTIKTNAEALLQELKSKEIEAKLFKPVDNCIAIAERQNLFSLDIFKKGYFEMQDAGSQMIGEFLRVEPGMRVIDACAGAGGKTLQLAAQMQNKGRIISMDIEDWKLQELKRRTRRAGVGIVETKVIDGTKTIKRLANTADRLLLDVPCSGLGVLKRNPDAKWKLDISFIERIKKTQEEILQSYPRMLKKGGLMVYATCSILPSENTQQVEKFLANNPEFELLEEQQLYPSTQSYDGFYMALIRKN